MRAGWTMPDEIQMSFTRYLEAKRSVDDRALNRGVWDALALRIASEKEAIDVLEVGGGVGTMLTRLLAGGIFRQARYRLVDLEMENIQRAPGYLAEWADKHSWGYALTAGGEIRLTREDCMVAVTLECADVYALTEQPQPTCDLLIANALLDLLDIKRALPALLGLVRPRGLFYFTINYDGQTLFEPEIDRELDEKIHALYNQTMDERQTNGQPSGDSRTGRRLFTALREEGAALLAAGSSDWVVFAGPDGYPEDEKYFLYFILHTVETALEGHPALDGGALTAWLAQRRAQIERGTLVYIAHQLDLLGRGPL